MKINSKEELKNALIELRKGKEKQENYIITPPSFACCYSIAHSRYKKHYYIGRHKCITCGKDFGTNLEDEISKCQEKRYEEYLKSGYIFSYEYPCFNNFHNDFLKANGKLLKYLRDEDLYFENHNKYRDFSEYSLLKPIVRKDEERLPESFNRPLTKKEWITLNTNCSKNQSCFQLDGAYELYQSVAQKYIEEGYDVKLEYNCDKCCSLGKNKIEFLFRFEMKDDYIKSYPHCEGRNYYNLSSYSDYMLVLDFLKGCHAYSDLLKKSYEKEYPVKKSQIDCALNQIVGTNIRYSKQEVILHANKLFPSKTEDNKLDVENKVVLEICNKVLSMFEDGYQFSIYEYFLLVSKIEDFKSPDLVNVNINSKKEIIEKRAISKLKRIDMFLTNKAIYDYLEAVYPKKEITTKTSSYEKDKYPKDLIKRAIMLGLFDKIYNLHGNDCKIKISLFDTIINNFDYLFSCVTNIDDLKDIKKEVLTTDYVKSLFEEE